MSSDFTLFMRELVRRPHQVVALAPSSRALATEMVADLTADGGPVIELGAGTGKITQAILDRGLPPDKVHSVEMNGDFCDRLRQRFPGLHVHHGSAGDIGALPVASVQAVVSGLPLLSMPRDLQHAILSGACAKLAPGGTYVQFTYGPKPPVTRSVRDALDLRWRVSHKIWWNLPPARVYRFWPAR